MNAMKGLLLGAAAGLVAMTGAQAADLPVKAKPVEYVKVCNLYGAGFFYVPGTDTCLKIGMYIRTQHAYGTLAQVNGAINFAGQGARGPVTGTTPAGAGQDIYSYQDRILLTTDWRTQSDYGVIRAYAAILANQGTRDNQPTNSSAGVGGVLRAFIQFAGFTVGHSVSVFDFTAYNNYGYLPPMTASTGVNGIDVIAYTWQLGNGVSASIDLEDGQGGQGRGHNEFSAGALGSSAALANTPQAAWSPDIAANIRVDQAWGSAQLSGALHNASAGYYTTTPGGGIPGGITASGHPDDTWGWSVQAGLRLNNFLMPKDSIEGSVGYASAATGYVTGAGAVGLYGSGNSIALAAAPDTVFATGGSQQAINSWHIDGAYEHNWNSQWRTSLFAEYVGIGYSDGAKAIVTAACAAGSVNGNAIVGTANCSPDWSMYQVSTRTAWNPHPTLEIGLDLIWLHVNTAFAGSNLALPTVGARGAGTYVVEDQDKYMAILRIVKTILP